MQMTCSGCGFDAPADFAFCPKCGARFAAAPPPPPPPAAPESDRRLVTVLFADLAGFTALSEGLPAPATVGEEAAASWPLSVTKGQLQPSVRVAEALNERDSFELVEVDYQMIAAHGLQLGGHFLIDQEGIIQLRHIEAGERIGDLARFPDDEEILRAARSL